MLLLILSFCVVTFVKAASVVISSTERVDMSIYTTSMDNQHHYI
jgi:hypothetical protein